MPAGLRGFKMLLLAAGDLLAAFAALALALTLRYGPDALAVHWQDHRGPFAAVFLLWLAIFYIVGLYDLEALRSRIELLSRTAEGLVAALIVSMAVFYFSPIYRITPKTNLALTLLLFAALFVPWRLLTMHLFSRTRFRLKVLFLGAGDDVRALCDTLEAKPHMGYACLETVAELPADGRLPKSDVLVVSGALKDRPELTGILFKAFSDATTVVSAADFHERIHHSVPEAALDERWILENLASREDVVYEHVKRLFDVVCGALFALPALALAPLVALAIRIEGRGPVLYRQARLGRGGRPFTIVKFRTMRVDAERTGAAFAAQDDPRVTRVGRFLRATRLDELPQLWNILRGEMSFVGPRPERPEVEAELVKTIPLFPVRHLCRPGLTGWAQVSAPYAATAADHLDKLRHDLYYLKHRTLVLDAAIVLKTIYSVLKRKGR